MTTVCTAYLNVMSQFECKKLLISDWKTDVTQTCTLMQFDDFVPTMWHTNTAAKHYNSILIIGKGFAYMCILNILRPVVNQGEQRKWGVCAWIYMDRKSQLSEEFPAEYLQTTISQEVNTNSINRPRPVFSAKRGIPGLESRHSKTIYVRLIENKRRNI